MRLKDLFEKWGLVGPKVKTPILEMNCRTNDPDKNAAWDSYVLPALLAMRGFGGHHFSNP
jgi:hypothetical protein